MELFIHGSYESLPNYKIKRVVLHFGTDLSTSQPMHGSDGLCPVLFSGLTGRVQTENMWCEAMPLHLKKHMK
jgi:hypothetical protein